MKKIVSICVFLSISLVSYAQKQNETLAFKVLRIYKEESLPFFEKFSSERHKGKLDDVTKALIASEYELLLVKADYITKTITDSLEGNEKGQSDKDYIAKLASFQYNQKFPGLPKEYWEGVTKRIAKL